MGNELQRLIEKIKIRKNGKRLIRIYEKIRNKSR